MSFSFKVAPGVRIRASSRGLRTSVGITAFQHIQTMHRQEFTPASPPVAPPLEPVDEAAIRRGHEEEALRGIGRLQRSARVAARERAATAAALQIQNETERREQERSALQMQLDGRWQRLLANDPEVVMATLTDAFEDNEAFAAAVGVSGDEVAVVVLVPPFDIIPERMPKVTDAGNLSLPKLSKRERSDYYTLLVGGHVLVTVRETLAVAPSMGWVRVATVRLIAPEAYGVQKAECLLAALFRREALQGIRWDSADAAVIMNDASAERSLRQGRSGELLSLDLAAEPGLAPLIHAFDIERPDREDYRCRAGGVRSRRPRAAAALAPNNH